jgi:hypothetical protein
MRYAARRMNTERFGSRSAEDRMIDAIIHQDVRSHSQNADFFVRIERFCSANEKMFDTRIFSRISINQILT